MPKKKSTGLLRISEAASLIGVSPMTLRRWDQSGHLEAIRVGPRRDRRYRKRDLLQILQKGKDE